MAQLVSGATIAGYRVEALVGRGGMGEVYRATQLSLDRQVALKVLAGALADDPVYRERFLREARLAASLDHPAVLPVSEAGEADGVLFLAMRYLEGRDLARIVAEEGPLEPGRAVRLVAQVGAALDAAHERGLVHRDVKPANVLVEARGGEERAFLTDFGIARARRRGALTATEAFIGTLDYVAPEQVQHDAVGPAGDLYALAASSTELDRAGAPSRAAEVAKMWAHVSDPVPLPRDAVPVSLWRSMPSSPARWRRAGRAVLECHGARPGRPGRDRRHTLDAGDADGRPGGVARVPRGAATARGKRPGAPPAASRTRRGRASAAPARPRSASRVRLAQIDDVPARRNARRCAPAALAGCWRRVGGSRQSRPNGSQESIPEAKGDGDGGRA